MKKLLSLILMIAMLAGSTVSYAKLTITGPNIKGHEDWFNEMQADNLVGRILNGNIAFVHNSDKAWVRDKKVTLSQAAKYIAEKEEFEISVADANKIFGLSETGTVVTSSKIISRTSLNSFIDPRGFVVFGNGEKLVDTSVPQNYLSYKDYLTVADAMSFIDWEDVEFTEEEHKAYLKKWREALTVPEDKKDEYADFISKSITDALNAAASITSDGKGGWNIKNIVLDGYDLTGAQLSTFKVAIKNAYKQVNIMATGYSMMDDKTTANALMLKEKILGCMDYLLGYYSQGWNYNTDSKQTWTTTQFELPIICANIICMMYDEMTQEQIIANTNQLFDKNPIPDVRTAGWQNNQETYTNRLWRCLSFFNVAALVNDSYRMNYAMKYTSSAYMYAARNNGYDDLTFGKDGFYSDGSMIFHNKTPYNMGYGMSYAALVYEFHELTKGTKFDMSNVYGFENVYDFCLNNLIPFTSNGVTMRMVHGRASTNADTAILSPCALIGLNGPEDKRNEIIAKIQSIMGERKFNPGGMNYELNEPIRIEMFKKYYEYAEKISSENTDKQSSTVYYNQDDLIHERENFTATLQMSSSRIAKFEAFPPNNSTGWYMGDGMLYVYTDNKQYGTNYFNTINPYYMPGTTVDSTPRKAFNTDTATSNGEWGYPENDWAGAVTDGENTSASYILGNQYVSGLEGRKSYFFIGDKIVCMGTGISKGLGRAYTVVENRIIDKETEEIKPIEVGYAVKDITTTNEEDLEAAWTTVDSNVNTSCPLGARGEMITYDFGEKVNIGTVGMAFLYGNSRKELALIQVSDDGENFTDVCEFESTGLSTDIELYDMDCSGRYFRVISRGNEKSAYFNLSEIIFYKDTVTEKEIEESKLIITSGFDELVVDGEVQMPVFNETHSVINPGWVWVENKQGFVFLKDAELEVMRERNPSCPVYMRMAINHGETPTDAEYAYVQMPVAGKEETEAFAQNPHIEILEMNKNVHAIYDKEQNKVYANVFRKDVTVDGIKFNTPCSVIIDKNALKMYISDPTWKNDRISFALPENISVELSDTVSVKNGTVTADISYKRGSTHILNYKTSTADGSSKIGVMDYNLKTSDKHYISTVLYASGSLGEVTFSIAEPPVNGRAAINGNVLHYTSAGISADKLVIEARDAAGNTARFNVNINAK